MAERKNLDDKRMDAHRLHSETAHSYRQLIKCGGKLGVNGSRFDRFPLNRQIFDPLSVIEPVLENLRNCLYPLGDYTYILETIVSPLSSKTEYARVMDFTEDPASPSSYMIIWTDCGLVFLIDQGKMYHRQINSESEVLRYSLTSSQIHRRPLILLSKALHFDTRSRSGY
jgi:hypothetical protein